MKRQIRKSVFETNSSSIHSIIISNDFPTKSEIPSVLHFCRDEFGWEWAIYNNCAKKANYLYECLIDLYYDWKDGSKTKLEQVCNQIKDALSMYGIECDFEEVTAKNWDDGYVDHGEENKELVEYLLSDPKNLIRFLFNYDSCISTGNDNDWYDDEYFGMPKYYDGIRFIKGN